MSNNNQDNAFSPFLENKAKLASALVKAIAETQDVHADSTNPFHKNKYASLGAHLALIKPIFAKHGLAILQFPTSMGSGIGVQTLIVHECGGSIENEILIPVSDNVKGQEAGAIISYLRRYALAAVAGIATDDDDAESDRISKSTSVTSKFITNVAKKPASVVVSETTGDVNFELTVPFGKNKGTTLSNLPLSDLEYWATKWEPKPWEKTGKVGAKDLALKASAQALWAVKSNTSEEQDASEQTDEVPF